MTEPLISLNVLRCRCLGVKKIRHDAKKTRNILFGPMECIITSLNTVQFIVYICTMQYNIMMSFWKWSASSSSPSAVCLTIMLGSTCAGVICPPNRECAVAANNRAICVCIQSCSNYPDPLCGSNNQTYMTECDLQRQSCLTNTNITVAYTGECNRGHKLTDLWKCIIVINPDNQYKKNLFQEDFSCFMQGSWDKRCMKYFKGDAKIFY